MLCRERKEPVLNKILVCILAVLNCARSFLTGYDTWHVVVFLYRDPVDIAKYLLKSGVRTAGGTIVG